MRIRHLLSHSAGLPNPLPVRWVHPAGSEGRDPRSFALELLERARPLRFPAGTKAAYSNLGYIVLGEVIGAAAGRRYEDYVQTQILEPLALDRTGFSYAGLGEDVATGYQSRFSPMTLVFRPCSRPGSSAKLRVASWRSIAFRSMGPRRRPVGSARDAARFMAVHLNGGELDGRRLLLSRERAAMQRIHVRGRKVDTGFGWYRRGSKRRSVDHVEHLGGGGGFWTMMRIFPERGLGILTMGNATTYDHERIASAALATAGHAGR